MMKSNGVYYKPIIAMLFLFFAHNTRSFSTAQGGYYMSVEPYYRFGSSYYYNPPTDYGWDGNGWIFDTGYRVPAKRCRRSCSAKRICNSTPKNNGCCQRRLP